MNSNKNIHKRPILISAVAAVCILVASSSGNAASTGGIPTQQENAVLTNTLRGDSTSTNTQRNTMSSKSGSTWRGAARAEWTQRWWRWWMSIPLGVGPDGAVAATGEGEEIVIRLLCLRVYERMAGGASAEYAGRVGLGGAPEPVVVGLIAAGPSDAWGGSNRHMPWAVATEPG